MPHNPQEALKHDPGRFRALFTFDAKADTAEARSALRLAATTLMKETESPELKTKPLQILVAVAVSLLEGHSGAAPVLDECKGQPGANAALLVQVAGETEDERSYALRLVRRVLSGSASLRDEYYSGRRTLGREAFGYRELPLQYSGAGPDVPVSAAMPGGSWLLYQRCVQHVDEFFAKAPADQDATIGRARDPDPARPFEGDKRSHVNAARAASGEGLKSKLLRRSIGYERYDEEGLLFLACAAHPKHLTDALESLTGSDRLKQFIGLKERGLYFVPPDSTWLGDGANVQALEAQRPLQEAVFFPRFPLVLYEVTPLTLQFFKRVFHQHKDHFDENGALREDLKLVTKGLAKLLYGGVIPADSTLFEFLKHAFSPDSSARVVQSVVADEAAGAGQAGAGGTARGRGSERESPFVRKLAALSNDRNQHEVAKRAALRKGRTRPELEADDRKFNASKEADRKALRAELTKSTRISGALGAPDWLNKTALDLYGEMVVNDAETMFSRSDTEKQDLDSLISLCERAAAEAREINDSVGLYMTFMC